MTIFNTLTSCLAFNHNRSHSITARVLWSVYQSETQWHQSIHVFCFVLFCKIPAATVYLSSLYKCSVTCRLHKAILSLRRSHNVPSDVCVFARKSLDTHTNTECCGLKTDDYFVLDECNEMRMRLCACLTRYANSMGERIIHQYPMLIFLSQHLYKKHNTEKMNNMNNTHVTLI